MLGASPLSFTCNTEGVLKAAGILGGAAALGACIVYGGVASAAGPVAGGAACLTAGAYAGVSTAIAAAAIVVVGCDSIEGGSTDEGGPLTPIPYSP